MISECSAHGPCSPDPGPVVEQSITVVGTWGGHNVLGRGERIGVRYNLHKHPSGFPLPARPHLLKSLPLPKGHYQPRTKPSTREHPEDHFISNPQKGDSFLLERDRFLLKNQWPRKVFSQVQPSGYSEAVRAAGAGLQFEPVDGFVSTVHVMLYSKTRKRLRATGQGTHVPKFQKDTNVRQRWLDSR